MNDQNALMGILLACLCKRGLGSGLARGTAQVDRDSLSQALALSGLSLLSTGFSFNFNVSLSPGAVAPAPAAIGARSYLPQQPQSAQPQPGLNFLSLLPVLLSCCLDDREVAQTAYSNSQIAQRAREIWEREKCPEGRAAANWKQAEEELAR